MTLLKLTNIHGYYGTSHIINGINLTIAPGQTISILGKNGMGKTSFIKTILNHGITKTGQVIFNGADISNAPTHQIIRAGIAIVPEGRGIFGNLTVRENLLLSATPAKNGLQAWGFDDIIGLFPRLGERINHGGLQLSGGEQQMLAIGRALMQNPQLLILDEATEGLAPLIINEIWDIINQLQARGLSIIVIDQRIEKILYSASHIIILEKGRIAHQAHPQSLIDNPQPLHDYLGV